MALTLIPVTHNDLSPFQFGGIFNNFQVFGTLPFPIDLADVW